MVAMKFNVTMFFLMVFMAGAAQVPFTSGNIVVYRVGTAGSALTSAATPVFLDEYTPAGVLVQSVAMPVAVSGSNQVLTGAGTAGTEGIMTLSADGQYLVVPGYNAAVGTATLTATTSAAVPRTIGLVKYDATINTTTALTDLSSAGSVRSAVSDDGTGVWACGNGTAGGTGGVRYAPLGATTSTRLSTGGPGALRALNITSGQLYVAGNTSTPKLGVIGTGMPTTSGQTVSGLPGFPTGGTPGQFIFADLDAGVAGPDVLYVADDNAGIQKYSHVGGSWTLNGTVGTGTDDYRGMAIKVSGTTVTLYTMRIGLNSAANGGGEFVTLTDASGFNGAFAGTPTVLATAVTNNTSFRGVALAPQALAVTPVKLMTFTARAINKDVRMAWSTASAINFSHFEVERSANGSTFTVAGRVNVRSTNNNTVDYTFTDAGSMNTNMSNGILHYRLKMVDIDGRFEYSKIIAVFMNEKKTGLINAYPAPFTNKVWVKVGLISAGHVHLSVTDLGGRVIKSMQLLLPAGENTVSVDELGSLPKGTYLLRVTIDDKITSMKLMK
ncbi:T9SS type A sorting domain-containing protein [Pseudoflavitalea sp. X16]|uniref:T9SS type A sorting domain-containing protein n=1 Tax=Paraflavitalea devenefica TaxID=2716334 RepID=UPI00141F57FE|nr:T9SS type A sorting domain-containing protein [Paraflavitalea devenefica]NII26831.1 T9SS type A sorting domain-containing protein [Paraflavitalea devenefica]